jgi:hypothetical protein
MVALRFGPVRWLTVRNRSLTVVLIALSAAAILSPGLPALAKDSIDEQLAAAKKAYEQGRSQAKDLVIARYRELIAVSSEKKKLEDASRIQDELNHFDKAGLMLFRGDMTKAFLKYGETLKSISDDLADAYAEAASACVKAGELNRADELRHELAAYSLPTKLVSVQLLRSRVYVMHSDYKGCAKPATSFGEKMNATFEIVNGLAETGNVSIRSANLPNHYLNHANLRLRLSPVEDSEGYRKNATFKKVKGLASPSAVSFESYNFPGHYIRARNGELWLDKIDHSDRFRQEASFIIGDPLFKLW